jgi:hypothetical protein
VFLNTQTCFEHGGFESPCFTFVGFEGPTFLSVAGGEYRGQLELDDGFLADVIAVIAGIVYLQVTERPLRHHMDFFDEEDEEIFAAIAPPPREVIDGHPIGTVRDISRLDDGTLVGPGDEPSDLAINTGCTVGVFAKGNLDAQLIAHTTQATKC